MDRSDKHHRACRRLLESTNETLVIPAPVLVEVDYFVHERLHAAVFVQLLDDIEAGAFAVADLTAADFPRVRELCAKYTDADIGFVDAAVLAVVERLGEPKLATIDRKHFGAVRPKHVVALDLLPG